MRKRLLSVLLSALISFMFVSDNNIELPQKTECVMVDMENRMSEPVAVNAAFEQMVYRQANIASGLNGYKMMNCKTSSNVVLGGFGDWTMLAMGIPSITIEIGKGKCPLSQSEFESIWNRNKEMWGQIAYHLQGYV